MKNVAEVDVVIVGGGIAGLWLLNRLRQLGYSAILLEAKTLGGGQTHKSQGIIHGGVKYALQGALTSATNAISDMPKVWEACLQGKGVLDLSRVPVLSTHQYLWSTGALTSKLTGFFASMMLKDRVATLKKESYPEVFQNKNFDGSIYSLEEIVIDVNTLIRELVKPNQDAIFKIDPLQENQLHFDATGRLASLEIHSAPIEPVQIRAQQYVFAAGSGNEILSSKLVHQEIKMQRRPLQMVMVKTDFPYSVYAHCLGLGSTPRMTITTHKSHDGKFIWYIGGQIAEEGVKRTVAEQIQFTKNELKELFPWLDFSNAQFTTFFVDRAEALQPNGQRPDSCFTKRVENIIVAWPTKLAFAPKLAEEVIHKLQEAHLEHRHTDIRELRAWPIPAFAKPIWDELFV